MSEELVYEPEKAVLDDVRQQPMYDPGLESALRNAGDRIPTALRLNDDEFYFECNNLHHAIRQGHITKEEVAVRYRELVDRANHLPAQFAGRWDKFDLEARAQGGVDYVKNTIMDAWETWRIPASCFDESANWSEYISGLPNQTATATDVETTLENALLVPAPDYANMKLPNTRQTFPEPLSHAQRNDLVHYAGRLTMLLSAGSLVALVPPRNDVEAVGVVFASLATSMWGVLIAKAYCNSKPLADEITGQEQNRDDAKCGKTRDEVKKAENKTNNGEETTSCYFSPI